jgi:mono/diheme cytochrome c family protein
VGSGVVADLRRSTPEVRSTFSEIVTNGLPGRGMPAFADILSPAEIAEIEAYVRLRAAE